MDKLFLLRERMKESDIDAVIIFDEINQRYLSSFNFSDGLLLISKSEALLITDFRYYESAKRMADKSFEVVALSNRNEIIDSFIERNSVKKMGFEGSFVSYETHRALCEKFTNVQFMSIGKMIEEQRKIKFPEELVKIQAAQDIADKAFSHLLKVLTPNMTEIEVAAELEYAMRKMGAEAAAFDTIAVSGTLSAVPHGVPRNVKLEKGFLTMDFGAKLDGYLSDMTRTIVVGKADSDMKKLYNTVLSAQLAAIDFLREGADAGEADKVARDIIDSIPEYKGSFGHALGHSIGLNVHESPSLSRSGFGTKLLEGQVTSVEPGIYLYGKYGCRIEDMVAIRKDGVHNFTHSTKELIEIY